MFGSEALIRDVKVLCAANSSIRRNHAKPARRPNAWVRRLPKEVRWKKELAICLNTTHLALCGVAGQPFPERCVHTGLPA